MGWMDEMENWNLVLSQGSLKSDDLASQRLRYHLMRALVFSHLVGVYCLIQLSGSPRLLKKHNAVSSNFRPFIATWFRAHGYGGPGSGGGRIWPVPPFLCKHLNWMGLSLLHCNGCK